MALPTLVKDWQVIANQTVAGDNSLDGTNAHRDRRNVLLGIKEQMIATAQVSDIGPTPGGAINNWTVKRSSDGSSAASSDLWSPGGVPDNTKLVWNTAGNAHAWIVLEQTGIATNFQICFDLIQSSNTSDGGQMTVVASPGGFDLTTGSTTARPTPTTADDEVNIINVDYWGTGTSGGAQAMVWNMWITEDGEATYLVILYADATIGFMVFAKPQDPATGWDGTQFVVGVGGSTSLTTDIPTIELWYDSANTTPKLFTLRDDRISTANVYNRTQLYFTADTFGGGPMTQELTIANDVTGEYALGTVGLASTEPGFRGKMGSMFDLYWGQGVLGQPADNYPSGGSKTWVQFADIVFPWDGAIPVTT